MFEEYKVEAEYDSQISILSQKLLNELGDELHHNGDTDSALTKNDIGRLEEVITESQSFYEAAEAAKLGALFNEINQAFNYNYNEVFKLIYSSSFLEMVLDAYDKLIGTGHLLPAVQLIANLIKSGNNEAVDMILSKDFFSTSEIEAAESDDKDMFTAFFKIYVWLLVFTENHGIEINFSKAFELCAKALDAQRKDLDVLASEFLFNIIRYNNFQKNINDIIVVAARLVSKRKNIITKTVLFSIKMVIEAAYDPRMAEARLRNSEIIDDLFNFVNEEDLSVASEQIVVPALELLRLLMELSSNELCDYYFRRLFKYNNIINAFDNNKSNVISYIAARIICYHIEKSTDGGKEFMESEDYFDIRNRFECNGTFYKNIALLKILDMYLQKRKEDVYELYMTNDFINAFSSFLDIQDEDSPYVFEYLMICLNLLEMARNMDDLEAYSYAYEDDVKQTIFDISCETEGKLSAIAKQIIEVIDPDMFSDDGD